MHENEFNKYWFSSYTNATTIYADLESGAKVWDGQGDDGIGPAVLNLCNNIFTKRLTRTVTKKVKVVDKAAYDEKVIDHYKCTVGGETKKK